VKSAFTVLACGLLVAAGLSAQSGQFTSNSEQGVYSSWNEGWHLPVTGTGSFVFKAQASNDIHIALSPASQTSDPMYEIVLGGWANTKSVIRRASQGPDLVSTANGPASPGALADYWVQVDQASGKVSAGTGNQPGQNSLIEYSDPQFLSDVRYFAFSSWDTPVQIASVETRATGLPGASSSAENGAYSTWSDLWQLPMSDRDVVRFTATATNDLHIALSSSMDAHSPMYELVLGGWANSKSAIRRAPQGPSVLERQAGLRAPGRPDRYWLAIDRPAKTLSIGFGDKVGEQVLMSWKDPNFLANVRYFDFSSWDTPVTIASVDLVGRPSGPGAAQGTSALPAPAPAVAPAVAPAPAPPPPPKVTALSPVDYAKALKPGDITPLQGNFGYLHMAGGFSDYWPRFGDRYVYPFSVDMRPGDSLDLTVIRPRGPNDPAPYFVVVGASGVLASPNAADSARTTYTSTVAEKVTLLLISEPSITPGMYQFDGHGPGTRMQGSLGKSSLVGPGGVLYAEIPVQAMGGAFYQVDADSPSFVTQLKAIGPDGKALSLGNVSQTGKASQAMFQLAKDGVVKIWLTNQGSQKPGGAYTLTVTNLGFGQ
jgi:hypothetical protein